MDQKNPAPPAQKKLLFRTFWRGQLIEVIKEGSYRSLRFDSHLVQTRVLEDNPDHLVLKYSQHMVASLVFLPDEPRRILMIGLGGGSLARFFLRQYPHCRIDVVEYNESIPALAHDYFFLPKDPRLSIIIADGAQYVATVKPNPVGYDLILVDAFDQSGMAASVYSKLFFKRAKKLLSQSGLMVLNMTRGRPLFFDQTMEILRKIFPAGLLRLPVDQTNNEIVIACQQEKAGEDWSKLKKRAVMLSESLEMDLINFFEQTMPIGKSFWSRWLGSRHSKP
ncbi:MAG: fused MFS/spermidine synthase [Magnetococcales bacterium]|nr:fused MFS/spermidine synthase [Magnetococcales bacterium]